MKIIKLLIPILILLISFSSCTCSKSDTFDWLLGKWQRENEEIGKKTFENWQKINDTEYNGLGFTLKDKDTIKQEKMKLIKSDGTWFLKVKTLDEKNYTIFRVSEMNKNSFTCTNDTIDFPNTIKYSNKNQRLFAEVSNNDMKIDFIFKKR